MSAEDQILERLARLEEKLDRLAAAQEQLSPVTLVNIRPVVAALRECRAGTHLYYCGPAGMMAAAAAATPWRRCDCWRPWSASPARARWPRC